MTRFDLVGLVRSGAGGTTDEETTAGSMLYRSRWRSAIFEILLGLLFRRIDSTLASELPGKIPSTGGGFLATRSTSTSQHGMYSRVVGSKVYMYAVPYVGLQRLATSTGLARVRFSARPAAKLVPRDYICKFVSP